MNNTIIAKTNFQSSINLHLTSKTNKPLHIRILLTSMTYIMVTPNHATPQNYSATHPLHLATKVNAIMKIEFRSFHIVSDMTIKFTHMQLSNPNTAKLQQLERKCNTIQR